MTRSLNRRSRQDRGAAALLVALLTVVLVGCLAFVSDLGMAYANQRRLQNGVDSAALAVGRNIAAQAAPTDDCATIKATYDDGDAKSQRPLATAMLAQNASTDATLASGTEGYQVTCETVGGIANTTVVRVRSVQDSPAFFGRVLGLTSVPVSRQARVIVAPKGSVVGLRPFAICRAGAQKLAASPSQVLTYSFDNADIGCGYAPGNWGVVDFNGGSNSTGEVADWIRNGYDGEISNSPPVFIPGDPGAPSPGALDDDMDHMMSLGDITLPVFDNVSGSGDSASFEVSGFIEVTPCGWKFNNKSGENPTCFVPPSPEPQNYLQVKFSRYIPIGGLNLKCPLGDSTCDNGLRDATLAD